MCNTIDSTLADLRNYAWDIEQSISLASARCSCSLPISNPNACRDPRECIQRRNLQQLLAELYSQIDELSS
jgi:hypothetical protein